MKKTREQVEKELKNKARGVIKKLLNWNEDHDAPDLTQIEDIAGIAGGVGERICGQSGEQSRESRTGGRAVRDVRAGDAQQRTEAQGGRKSGFPSLTTKP